MIYAKLGSVNFQLLTGPKGLNVKNTFNYASHDHLDGKPSLQFLGEGLDEVTLTFYFHAAYCTPKDEVENLRAEARKATPLPFVMANGDFMGEFVIEEIEQEITHTDGKGFISSAEVDVKLREFDRSRNPVLTTQQRQKVTPTTKKKSTTETASAPLPPKESVDPKHMVRMTE